MIFLTLETTNTQAMETFYVDILGLFSCGVFSNRIECTSGLDLIIDFKLVQQSPICGINFGMFHESGNFNIIQKLEAANIQYEFADNKGGATLRVADPEGNMLSIRAGNSDIT